MLSNPQDYLQAFRQAGADVLTIHAEAVSDPVPLLREIRSLGAAAGLAINPPTPWQTVESCLDDCDLVLVMSVMPGFGGQQFDPIALEKLRSLRDRTPRGYLLEVDGGLNADTVPQCAAAGAELFAVGSAIFRSADYRASLDELTSLAQTHCGGGRNRP